MRLFIAVWVEGAVKAKIIDFLTDISFQAQGVKWVTPAQLHFTLKFLGEQNSELIKDLLPVLKEVGRKSKAFTLALGGGGTFPPGKTPRILWLGLEQGRYELKKLAEEIEDAVEGLGLPREKRGFKPHLTVGRVKSCPCPRSDSFDRLRLEQGVRGEMVVSGFSLVQSVLRPEGPVYKDVERFYLDI